MGVSSIEDGGEVVGEGSRGCLGAGTHLASMDQTARKPGACDAEPPARGNARLTAKTCQLSLGEKSAPSSGNASCGTSTKNKWRHKT